MSASSPIPESVRRDLERMAGPLAERMLPPKVTQSATTRNVVAAVNDDGTVDVMMGGAVMQRVPATTACVGVAVGDEVIVERYGPRLYCVGVVAKTLDNVAYVRSGYVRATEVANNATSDVEVTFDEPFDSTPEVVACLSGVSTAYQYGLISVGVVSVSASGFTLRFYNAGAGPREPSARWVAVAP